MKKNILIAALLLCAMAGYATSTTYQFTSEKWKSKVGSIVCDGTTDGWTGEADGYAYSAGRTYTDGTLHDAGVQVTKDLSGKKVTSVIEFQKVRKVIINFCLSSKGGGDLVVSVGETELSKPVSKSMKTGEEANLNEDIEFVFTGEPTGKVVLRVDNAKSSVFINTVTIKADNGSGDVFSNKVYHLVTDVSQLKDSDLIMIGIADGKTNKALGYFDESISKNNIHAINAKYDNEREYINANEEVTYVLRTAVSEKGKQACFTIIDPYAEAFLVASGGKTKNALRLWDKAYDPNTYGDYGYWKINVSAEGVASIMSLGNSVGKYMQYNPTFELFGCYAEEKMTAVSIYRQEEQKDPEQPMIVAPMVRFGTAVMRGVTELEGSKTIEVKANKLTENIAVSLKSGKEFSLSTTTLDRDGDKLTIIYKVSAVGKYIDTLVLESGTLKEEAPIQLTVARELSIAEAVKSGDFEYIYLNPVTVTKKYDRQVYVRDQSGAMMLYDEGPDQARYAKDLENGHVLREVEGKFQNYWGVPELHLMAQPKRDAKKTECLPDTMTVCADSADVCRYIFYDSIPVVYGKLETEGGTVPWPAIEAEGKTLLLSEWFQLPDKSESMAMVENRLKAGEKHQYKIEGIVSYDYDDVVLYPTMITLADKPDDPSDPGDPTEGIDKVTGNNNGTRKFMRHGTIYIYRNGEIYSILGNKNQ